MFEYHKEHKEHKFFYYPSALCDSLCSLWYLKIQMDNVFLIQSFHSISSTPIDWSELKKGLLPTTYNALNIFDRLKTEGDLFKPVLGKGINLEKVLSKLSGMIG